MKKKKSVPMHLLSCSDQISVIESAKRKIESIIDSDLLIIKDGCFNEQEKEYLSRFTLQMTDHIERLKESIDLDMSYEKLSKNFDKTLPEKMPILLDVNGKRIGKNNVKAIFILWKNRKLYPENYEFDYPNYGELPKSISNKLSSGFVDNVQDYFGSLVDGKYKTLKQFASSCFDINYH